MQHDNVNHEKSLAAYHVSLSSGRMGIGTRIAEARNLKGLTQQELAQAVGVGQSTVAQWEKGKNEPSLEFIQKIAGTTQRTAAWIAFGDDEAAHPTIGLPKIINPSPNATSGFLVEFDNEELAFLPVYDLRLSAGPGTWCEDDCEPLYFQPCAHQWLRAITASTLDHLLWARADGDSMEPTIHDADMVLIDRSRRRPSRDGIYGLRWDDSLLLKRVAVDPRNGLLTLSSDNTRYPTYAEVRPDSVDLIGRSVWLGRKI